MSDWNKHYPVEEIGETDGHYVVKTYRLREPLPTQVSSWEELRALDPSEDEVQFATEIMSTGSTDPKPCYKCRDCGVESGGSPTYPGVECNTE